jgi:hypothetical protein
MEMYQDYSETQREMLANTSSVKTTTDAVPVSMSEKQFFVLEVTYMVGDAKRCESLSILHT